ncbi:MAG: DUF421 domain-containing protein [Defluviitaleaceae bacterium]|nr:DUF421 domain-containing protein [Defluviitaleaceae bacterium]
MLDTIIRTVLGFAVLLILTRLLGKKQLSQLTVFTYITGIALGSMSAEMVLQKDVNIADGIAAMALWSLLVYIVEWISLKSATARVLLDGEPTIVIKKGHIQERALKKQRLNIDDLTMQLRLNQVFTVADVEYAILEPNGALTVMKKPSAGLPAEIITDGKVVEKNLAELGYSREALNVELRKQGIIDIRNVLYAELQPDRSLHIQQRSYV